MKNFKFSVSLNIVLPILLVLLSVTSACSGGSNEQDRQAQVNQSNPENAKSDSNSELSEIISAYLQLKEALVNDDQKGVAKPGQTLQNLLQKRSEEVLRTALMHTVELNKSQDLAVQRQHFLPLSRAIIEYLKAQDGIDQTLYVQYCPMAFDNTGGEWVSDSKDVFNPYFGASMLRCGAVKSEIAAK